MSQLETAVIEAPGLVLPVVDGMKLGKLHRDVLLPGQAMRDRAGRVRILPRFFYEVGSWKVALELPLTPHFILWEFLTVDVREAAPQRTFPRYVPCAITVLAAHLELFRSEVGSYVHIAANGGYRSPAHRGSRFATPHCWGAAANIYRIGGELLDTQERIERYGRIAKGTMPGVWVRPYGSGEGFADDHLHVDLGHVSVIPRGAGSEEIG